MSGSKPEIPSVSLFGPVMASLVLAIPEIEARTGRPVTLVGGLAVLCRLGTAYRVTSDVDTANHRAENERSQLEVLIDSGARPQGPSGVRIRTSLGDVQVDVLEVSDHELHHLPDDPNDRLHVMAHSWGISSASPMSISVVEPTRMRHDSLQVRVAAPGPLVAMKMQAVMNRPAAKEATDLLDIVRLMLDPVAGPASRQQLADTDPQLAGDIALHAKLWFVQQRTRTAHVIKTIPEGRDVDLETVDLVADLLLGELDHGR